MGIVNGPDTIVRRQWRNREQYEDIAFQSKPFDNSRKYHAPPTVHIATGEILREFIDRQKKPYNIFVHLFSAYMQILRQQR